MVLDRSGRTPGEGWGARWRAWDSWTGPDRSFQTQGRIYVDADQALALLKELSDRGIPFPAYVEEARKALEDMNGELNSMNTSVQALDDQLESLGYGLSM